MSFCGLIEKKNCVVMQEVEKTVKASQRKGVLSQFLKMSQFSGFARQAIREWGER